MKAFKFSEGYDSFNELQETLSPIEFKEEFKEELHAVRNHLMEHLMWGDFLGDIRGHNLGWEPLDFGDEPRRRQVTIHELIEEDTWTAITRCETYRYNLSLITSCSFYEKDRTEEEMIEELIPLVKEYNERLEELEKADKYLYAPPPPVEYVPVEQLTMFEAV